MKILKMTATFGKLENQTLTFQPNLNIISAPNEWGKSTWCAFLTAMLYGIDTKERTTKDALAVKERYAPWSGLPMSGTMEIEWNDRKITIQRSHQGRIPFGGFSAYETESGLPVPELTAANCGKVLLGIEKEVFVRTAFLRLTDLPITDDGALRDRLNALVTTGDESGADTLLTEKLQKLRNACKHNKTGKLPEAEREKDALLAKLLQLDSLETQQKTQQMAVSDLTESLSRLQNHKTHLLYQKAKSEESHLHNAANQSAQLRQEVAELEKQCAALPPEEETRYNLKALNELHTQLTALQGKPQPKAPDAPIPPIAFAGLSGEEAVRRAREEQARLAQAKKPVNPLFLILDILMLLLSIVMSILVNPAIGAALVSVGMCFLVLYMRAKRKREEDQTAICKPFGDLPPDRWLTEAESYRLAQVAYQKEMDAYNAAKLELATENAQLTARLSALTLGKANAGEIWNQQLALRDILSRKREALAQSESHETSLRAVIKPVPAPETADTLTLSEPATDQALAQAEKDLTAAQTKLQQLSGQLLSYGDRDALERSLKAVAGRIAQLNDYYTALTVALETAASASQNLQRRFAPAISQRAQALFSRLTDGRYDRLVLNRDFTLQVAAQSETVLQDTRFRSDGTVDQLYLALRLAVTEVVSPDAPLLLDDALVRFDDQRLSAALTLLQEEAKSKQVILFTCQSREQLTIDN